MGPDSPRALEAMGKAKEYLDPWRRWIHSLVLFGSYPKEDVHKIISSASQRVLIPVRNGLLRRQN